MHEVGLIMYQLQLAPVISVFTCCIPGCIARVVLHEGALDGALGEIPITWEQNRALPLNPPPPLRSR